MSDRLAEIENRLKTIETKEPWKAWDRGIGYEIHCQHDEPINDGLRETFKRGDAVFIAHSPSDVAYLLAELRKRDEAIARVEVLVDMWERIGGPGSEAERVYKIQQKLSVGFAVARIRAAVKGDAK